MHKRKQIVGIVNRRRLNDFDNEGHKLEANLEVPEPIQAEGEQTKKQVGLVGRNDFVWAANNEVQPKKKTKHRRKKGNYAADGGGGKKKRSIAKRIGLVSGVLVLGLIGFVVLKGWTTLSNIIERAGSGSPLLGGTKLHGEGDGRINILLLGIGDQGHAGSLLADTIMVISIDPLANEAGMLSVPRDLYVPIPAYTFDNGKVFSGSSRKINEAHFYGETNKTGGGPELMGATLENILGIPIHYYVRVDFTGFKKAVDAVGGIDIELDKRVYDPVFNREYGFGALDIGPGLVHLDGQTALMLGRARGSTGGVGLVGSDFARGEHQRLMLVALKNKALSVETLANPIKAFELMSALGSHVRTNLQQNELIRLRQIIEKIPSENIFSYGLDNSADNFLVSTRHGNASTLSPRSGNFDDIKAFVRSIFVDGFIRQEEAIIDVLNGSDQSGLASLIYNDLKSRGYFMGRMGDAQMREQTILIDLSGDNPFTLRYLEQNFKLKTLPKESLPSGILSSADFVLILGNNAKTESR